MSYDASFQTEGPDLPRANPVSQGTLTLAAAGAWVAAAYWAALTALIGFAGQSTLQMIVPFLLIGLYAYRGYQLFRGDLASANRLLWLHGLGAAVTVFQIASGVAAPVLLGIKIAIHVFGLVTVLLVINKARASRA